MGRTGLARDGHCPTFRIGSAMDASFIIRPIADKTERFRRHTQCFASQTESTAQPATRPKRGQCARPTTSRALSAICCALRAPISAQPQFMEEAKAIPTSKLRTLWPVRRSAMCTQFQMHGSSSCLCPPRVCRHRLRGIIRHFCDAGWSGIAPLGKGSANPDFLSFCPGIRATTKPTKFLFQGTAVAGISDSLAKPAPQQIAACVTCGEEPGADIPAAGSRLPSGDWTSLTLDRRMPRVLGQLAHSCGEKASSREPMRSHVSSGCAPRSFATGA